MSKNIYWVKTNLSKGKRGEFRATVLYSKLGALKPNMATVVNSYREKNVEYIWVYLGS